MCDIHWKNESSNQKLNMYSGRTIKLSDLVYNLTAICEYSNTVS